MAGLWEYFLTNPYFSAGFGLIGVGAGAQILRKSTQFLLSYARRQLVVSIELPSRDQSYTWFLFWMSRKITHTQQLTVHTSFNRLSTARETGFHFLPSVGNHYFKYNGTWIKAERTREKAVIDLRSGAMWESVVLTMPGRDKHLLFHLLEEAKHMALEEEDDHTVIYTAIGPEWRPFGSPRRRRPFDSVILPNNLTENLYLDVMEFLNNPNWYTSRGIPYRRGYLLHGPPGCGKSSYVQALAGRLQYNICILSLSDIQLTDDRLNHLLVNSPDRSILLLEDIDAAFQQREITSRYQNYITFSGLLNALDGVAAAEGRILFMTTNHIEKLDEALIRPGRVDRIEHLGYASLEMIKTMFHRFYPDQKETTLFDDIMGDPTLLHVDTGDVAGDGGVVAAGGVREAKISMAHLQGIFLSNKTTPQSALQIVKKDIHSKQQHQQQQKQQN